MHPKSEATIVGASQKVGPRRAPSTRRKGRGVKVDDDDEAPPAAAPAEAGSSVIKEFNDSLSVLLTTIAETNSWHVLCLRPNDAQLPAQLDARLVTRQIRALALPELASRLSGEWSANLGQKEWWDRYEAIDPLAESTSALAPLTYRDKASKVREIFGWTDREMAIGTSKVGVVSECPL